MTVLSKLSSSFVVNEDRPDPVLYFPPLLRFSFSWSDDFEPNLNRRLLHQDHPERIQRRRAMTPSCNLYRNVWTQSYSFSPPPVSDLVHSPTNSPLSCVLHSATDLALICNPQEDPTDSLYHYCPLLGEQVRIGHCHYCTNGLEEAN
jgi:hypothetical protein